MAKKDEPTPKPGLGAIYQAGKLTGQIGAPLAYQAITDRRREGFIFRLKSRNYWKGNAVALADQWGSKKLGHAAALSRKSITALAPEVLAIADGADRANLDPVGTVNEVNANMDGYGLVNDSFDFGRVKPYGVAKYGLGIGRKIVNKTRIADPIKKFLSMFGATL